ncbi:MAG: Mitochondrial distribution and morphology protein 31, mitochondrial precursor [Chrysothrix sp. TS-e1954]|nr:MAG: Mitochondrial distribution and morphology protein 31, mitochondrial precursor [Chrysothrix sp. TS-e1954]
MTLRQASWSLASSANRPGVASHVIRSTHLTLLPRHILRPCSVKHTRSFASSRQQTALPVYPSDEHHLISHQPPISSSARPYVPHRYKTQRHGSTLCNHLYPRASTGDAQSDLHLYSRTRRKDLGRRAKSSSTAPRSGADSRSQAISPRKPSNGATPKGAVAGAGTASSKALRDRLPDLSSRFHRPTKEELLAAATGFWSRLRVRFKWFSIRSVRPFNSDDISAFFSWILLGHIVWIIVGTTTFFSLLVFAVNTVFAQETLARWVGNYLTKSSGVSVVFESAIVPAWKDGVLSFKNVFVSRRPGSQQADFSKGSQISAAAAAAAAASSERQQDPKDETNYTQYDVSIETVNVTLSFTKWFNGKGLLKDVEVKGVRGVLDRTSIHHSADYIDPRTYLHEHNTGDFELESFKMEDLLVSVYQPGDFRPFSVSVFSADLPQLRKQWLFYDLLSANHLSGSFDDSPFFIHPQQSHNQTGVPVREGRQDEEGNAWKKHSRIRVDGLRMDHLNRGIEGPFSWIHDGNVDIVADVMLPADNDESIAKVMSDFYDRVEASVTNNGYLSNDTQAEADSQPNPPTKPASAPQATPTAADTRFLILDLRVHLNSVHATVPIFTRDLSYVNNALIRPIVAYINNKRASIPINCRVVKRVSEFDGSWTIYDSGLMEDLSRETYDAFERDVVDDRARLRRFKKVGLWSLEMAVRALFLGLAGNIA